ncbi:MAG: SprT-like domain-containing protein [Sulfurimonas sp.]|jgi:predicted SprT family Zn-dependent metalloprotease|nr:SprT-like domain-containing protein [Sulfurimonas sp.]
MLDRLLSKIQNLSLGVVFLALAYLTYNYYETQKFKNNPIPSSMQERIDQKAKEIEAIIQKVYNIDFEVPIYVSDKLPKQAFGITLMNKQNKIAIYLNKNVMRESFDYMIDDVLPHEYAHALLFRMQRGYAREGDGHSLEWQEICLKLGGSRCDRFVNHDDVIREKLGM